MSAEDELTRLKEELKKLVNLVPPDDPMNLPSGPPELVRGYKAGFVNGFIFYRQTIKRILFPDKGG